MIDIFLKNKLDRHYLFTNIKAQLHAFIKNGVVELSLASDCLLINVKETFDFDETIKPAIAEVLKKHIIETREEIWMLDIIQSIFFYDDPEEQGNILSMAKSILAGERLDLPNVTKLFMTEMIIYNAFMDFLKRDCKFCYESFLTFRLREYLDRLIDCVEMSIDEYQLEQEYQNIVESLRYYLKKQKPKINIIHVLVDEQFTFYDEYYKEIDQETLQLYLDQNIIFEKGLSIDEMVISPLVSIAPSKIFIYSNDFDNGIIRSLQNIFQERLNLMKREYFQSIVKHK